MYVCMYVYILLTYYVPKYTKSLYINTISSILYVSGQSFWYSPSDVRCDDHDRQVLIVVVEYGSYLYVAPTWYVVITRRRAGEIVTAVVFRSNYVYSPVIDES